MEAGLVEGSGCVGVGVFMVFIRCSLLVVSRLVPIGNCATGVAQFVDVSA